MNSTKLLKAQRIQRAKEVIGRLGYANSHAIAQQLAEEFGVHIRTGHAYLFLARQEIIESTRRSKDDHIADVLASLQEIVQRSDDDKSRLKALEMVTKLLGLNATKTINLAMAERPQFDAVNQRQMLNNPALQAAVQECDKLFEIEG